VRNMARPNVRRLVLAVFREKEPLTDAELAWWIRDVLQQNPGSAKRKRRELTRAGEIRFARQVKITESGRLQKKWELAPARR